MAYFDNIKVDSDSVPSTGEKISGTVETQAGDPVENATVVLTQYDNTDYDSKASEARDKINDVQEQLRNPEPPDWQSQVDDGFQFTGPTGKLETTDDPWILMHTQAQWQEENVLFPGGGGTSNLLADPDLSQPIGFSAALSAPADEPIVLTPWDPDRGNDIAENDIDADLPGAAVPPDEASEIVVEQVAPGSNDVVSMTRFEVEKQFEAGLPPKDVGFVVWDPPPGFYRVYPANHSDHAVIYAVGKPSELVQPYVEDLKDREDALVDTAQHYQDRIDNGTITKQTTTTNSSGEFSVTVDSRFDEVDVIAYRVPEDLDPQNATRADVREYYANIDYDVPDAEDRVKFEGDSGDINATSDFDSEGLPGSVYLPADTKTVEPPQSGVTVQVREVSAPTYAPINNTLNQTERFREWLKNLTYSELPAWLQERLNSSNVTRQDLEELHDELDALRKQYEKLNERYCTLLKEQTDQTCDGDFDSDDATESELRERIQALQQAIAELRTTIEAEDTEVETGNNSVTTRFYFDRDLDPENVVVRALFSNGTTDVLNESSPYLTIDQRVGRDDVVRIEDYPLGEADPAAVTFRVDIATPEGIGTAKETVTNPTFEGTVPAIEGIDLSSLSPGPDQTVQLSLTPEDPSAVDAITALTVHGPDGATTTTNVTDDLTAEFDTGGEGAHHVKLTFNDTDGNEFTTTFRVLASARDRALPPGVRVVESPVGTYALTGDGLDAGSVDVEDGGNAATITAQVGAGEEVPAQLDIYAMGLDLAPQNDLTVRVVRGDTQQNVNQQVVTTIQMKALPEDATLYREGEAIPTDGTSSLAKVSRNDSKTTIETITEGDGAVTITSNANPGLIERAQYFFAVRTNNADIPFLGLTGPLVPMGFVEDLLAGWSG